VLLGVLVTVTRISGLTLDELQNVRQLTPEVFARFFRDFEFKYHDHVQAPEMFLATQSGDCDDYATLASQVLKQHGYSPRLIAVRMAGLVHVVCYIPEVNAYLDYNQRSSPSALVRSGAQLADVARSVARSYSAKWVSASEFTYESGVKRLIATVTDSRPGILASLLR
jgi:hypothetical protein